MANCTNADSERICSLCVTGCLLSSCLLLRPSSCVISLDWLELPQHTVYFLVTKTVQRECFCKCIIPVPPVTADGNKHRKVLGVSNDGAFQNINPKLPWKVSVCRRSRKTSCLFFYFTLCWDLNKQDTTCWLVSFNGAGRWIFYF